MNRPSLSIIMPAYNTDKFIGKAIESILHQTIRDFELIIINDGSTDHTKTIVNLFKDDRIKYYENTKNSGIVFSRNKGLKLAKGKYIGMFDSDDIAYPEKFEKQITFLENNKEYGMIGSWAKFIDINGDYLKGSWKLKASPEMIPSIMLFKNYFLQSAVLYRNECIKKYSFKEDFDILEDYIIWLEIIKKHKAWNLQEYLVDYRMHEEGVTKKHNQEKVVKEKKVFKIQLDEIGINSTEEELRLHSSIRYETPINNLKELQLTEDWLLKIVNKNNETQYYDHTMLKRVVFNRWLKVCFKARGLKFIMLSKLISSQIVFNYINSYNPFNRKHL